MNRYFTPVKPAERKHLQTARTFQGIPSIARTAGGRLWAAWYSGGETECAENFVLLLKSDDNGETWSDAVFAVDPVEPETRAYDQALWVDPQNRLHLFWAESSSVAGGCICDGYSGVWHAVLPDPDGKNTNLLQWSIPVRIADGIMLNKPTVLQDGTWALPISVWAAGVGGAPFQSEVQGFVGAGLWASSDHGQTFSFRGRARVTHGNIFDEHMFVELKTKTLKAFIRTCYGFAESISTDGGYNWTSPIVSSIPGPNSRLFIRRLRSGRLLLVVNQVRTTDVEKGDWRPRREMVARLSNDDGVTWSSPLMLDERENVSYPDGDEADDGTIFIIHDHERYKEGNLFLSRFTEADILAGTLVSPGSKLKIPVSHTGGVPK